MAPYLTTLQTIGNWKKEVGVPLRDALFAYMDVTGKNGERACRKAIVEMAKSAGALATKARKNRRVKHDEHGKYVDVYPTRSSIPRKLYEWAFSEDNPDRINGTWEDAKRIGNQGLAKRSWLWGLQRLGAKPKSRAIAGTSRIITLLRDNVAGYIKINKLSYIVKAMPAGWETTVIRNAGNRIIGEARRKLERRQRSAMLRRERRIGRGIHQYFLKGLS